MAGDARAVTAVRATVRYFALPRINLAAVEGSRTMSATRVNAGYTVSRRTGVPRAVTGIPGGAIAEIDLTKAERRHS